MPISTSSSLHFPLSGGSRSRRRRILWHLNHLDPLAGETVEEEISVPSIESIMQDGDRIHFDFRATFTGVELDEKKELKSILLPDLDELVVANSTIEKNPESVTESDIDISSISESEIFSDSKIISSASESSISKKNSASFQQFRDLINSENSATWLFSGDSIAHGANFTQGYRIYSEHFSERIRTEMNRTNDVIINTAVAGETSKTILKKLEDRIIRFQPDVVSLMIGIDDSESGTAGRKVFQKNLREIIEQVRETGSLLFLHTPPYFDPSEHKAHADIRAYVKIIRETAREYWIPCLDHWNLWKLATENQQETDLWYAPNGVHPSAQGQHELAKQVFRRFGIFDAKSSTCSKSVSQIH
jgi:acyl-CoA thioesterase I